MPPPGAAPVPTRCESASGSQTSSVETVDRARRKERGVLIGRYVAMAMSHPDVHGLGPRKVSRVLRAYLAITPREQVEAELHTGVCSRAFLARLMVRPPVPSWHRGNARGARHMAGGS
jgi:hypothetical protein